MNYNKQLGVVMAALLAMMAWAGSASAATYAVAGYFPLLNTAPGDERVYEMDGALSFERSGGVMAARTAPGLSNGPTVPANLIQSSDGSGQLFTITAQGWVMHGFLSNDPVYHYTSKEYNYSFVTPPVSAVAVKVADFASSNLTTPQSMLPAVVDTAVQTVFTRDYATVSEYSDAWSSGVSNTFVHEVVTVDDNGGLLFDLTNPANPDYDPAFFAMWRGINGGTGASVLRNLLKVTIQDTRTGIAGAFVWNPSNTMVMYLAAGVGVVYMTDSTGNLQNGRSSVQKLLSYKLGAQSGSAVGIVSARVQLQDLAGVPLAGKLISMQGPQVFDPLAFNPANPGAPGANVPSYTFDTAIEETPGSGIFKLYYNQGDLVDLTLGAAGYADQPALAQNLSSLSVASAPNPVSYTMNTLLGTISGQVTDAAGTPLANVRVFLNDPTPPPAGSFWTPPVVATTDVNGNYSAQVDPAVSYGVSVPNNVDASGLSQLSAGVLGGTVAQNGQITTNQAALPAGVFRAASATTTTVNIQLAAGAVISGILKDTNGAAYANAQIALNVRSGAVSQFFLTVTDAAGHYSLTAASGSYAVQVSQAWGNAPTPFPTGMMGGFVGVTGVLGAQGAAKAFVLSVATPTTLNMQLVQGAVISGTVTDPSGVGVANAQIQVNDLVGGLFGFTATDGLGKYSVTVAPSAAYTIQVTPGWDPATGQQATFPNGMTAGYVGATGTFVPNPAQAKTFNFQIATPRVVNMQLTPGATVSGVLRDVNGTPYANAQVTLNAGGFQGVTTAADGSYSITVAPGSYTMTVTEGWTTTNQPVPFPAGMMGGNVTGTGALTSTGLGSIYTLNAATTTVVNMQLAVGAVVNGLLTDVGGIPYANAQIFFSDSIANQYGFAVTDATGHYSVTVASGNYTVNVQPGFDFTTNKPVAFPSGMLGGYVGATGALIPQLASAKKHVLAIGVPTTINMQLAAGAVVSGILKDATGIAYTNANASIILSDLAGGYGGWALTDVTGHYSLTVPAGTYTLQVVSSANDIGGRPMSFPAGMAGGYVSTGGGLVQNVASAKQYVMQAGTPVVINAQLITGATISGVLTDAQGLPVANAVITVDTNVDFGYSPQSQVQTDATGHYTISVVPGSGYIIQVIAGFDPVTRVRLSFLSGSLGGYVDATGVLSSNMGSAQKYTFTTGSNSVVNLQLAAGAIVKGQVQDLAGAPYAFAQVSLYSSLSGWGGATTDANGNYSVTVYPGTYTIQVGQGVNLTTGQLVPLPAGMLGGYANAAGPLTGSPGPTSSFILAAASPTIVNMQLVAPTLITGTLTDTTGAPYANAEIYIMERNTGLTRNATTDASGQYSVTVVSGTYYVLVSPSWDPATGQQIAFPAGMMGGYAGTTGALVQQQSAAQNYVVTNGTTTVVNMQLLAGAAISGILTDAVGAPFANAIVNLIDFTSGAAVQTTTDISGSYLITVVPGSYTIMVSPGWDPITGQQITFPTGMTGGYVANAAGALTQQFNAAKKFAVTVGTTTVVNMQLVAGAVITGTLNDANGQPYANARIYLSNPVTGVWGGDVFTDATGSYSITVTPGSYTIQALPGYDPATGKQVPFPAGMTGGYVDATGALTQQFNTAKTYAVTAGATTVVNMHLTGSPQAGGVVNTLLGLSLGDVNANGSGDVAVLGKRKSSGKYVVRVKDPNTVPHLIREIGLNGAYKPVQMVKLPDMNANGSSEIAVLEVDPITGLNRQIQVKDGRTGVKIVNIQFKQSLKPVQMVVLSDANGNGSTDIAVLEVDPATGLNRQIQVKDGRTGALIRNIPLKSTVKPHQMVSVGLINGAPALAVSEVDAVTGKNVQIQVKNARTGALIRNIRVNRNTKPHMLVSVGNIGGAPALALSEVDAVTGKNVQIQVKNASTGALIRNIPVKPALKPHMLVSVGNIGGVPALALSEVNATTGKNVQIQVKNARTGALIRNIRVNSTTKPHALIVLADVNGNGSPELALSEVNATTGKNVQVQVKDAQTGAKVRNIPMNPNYTPLGMGTGPDSNGNGIAEIGLLEVDGAGHVQVQIKDPLTGAKVSNLAYPKF